MGIFLLFCGRVIKFDKMENFSYNISVKIKRKEFPSVSVEVMRALLLIAEFCTGQDNCGNCPMRDLCGKFPCEW